MGRHSSACSMACALIAAILLLSGGSALAQTVRFDFETGDLQGWEIVEGGFGNVVTDVANYHNGGTPYASRQGKRHLSTLEDPQNQPNDPYVGVIESPVVELTGPQVTCLVGGGNHADTYIALCTLDGKVVQKASGQADEILRRTTWNVPELVGKKVFLRVVDSNTGAWGHLDVDDVTLVGKIDAAATKARFGDRVELASKARLAAKIKAVTGQLDFDALTAAIQDLTATFGPAYPQGPRFLEQAVGLRKSVEQLADKAQAGDAAASGQIAAILAQAVKLKRQALLSNPLVSGQPILFINRPQYAPDHHATETMFQTQEINTGSFQGGGAMKILSLDAKTLDEKVKPVISAPKGIARDPDVSFDGKKILFSMRNDIQDDYHVYEINADGTGLRQLTWGSRLSDIDPFYLADDRIAFSSTRDMKYCHCNRHIMPNLFSMEADGANVVQIGGNDLTELHGSLMSDGRILYDRWEYVDRHFGPSFGLWTANPDGTNHSLFYGNNSWAPGAIVDAHQIPGTEKVVCILGSCHDRPWGALAVIDRRLGMDGPQPVVKLWPESSRNFLKQDDFNFNPGAIDIFTNVRPKYEDPCPLADAKGRGAGKYFLVSRMISDAAGEAPGTERMALFVIDTFGNTQLLHDEAPGCFDPTPLAPRARPLNIPARTNLAKAEGTFYVYNVYQGTGMNKVAPGTIKYLRIIEAPPKRAWANEGGGIDAAQVAVMNWNTTVSKAIIGDVPVEADGSAYFTLPANKFVFFQALDKDKMMVQSMRSGTMIMPGETTGCVGCHENRHMAVPNDRKIATSRAPSTPQPWFGPTRDFNYYSEVQPAFDRNCVKCHDFGQKAGEKLNLSGDLGVVFNTSYLELNIKSAVRWEADAPGAPKILIKAIHDGPPGVLPPYAWGSHRSRLVDVIRGPEHSKRVNLSREDFERIVTWIDMNVPYYGSYYSAYPSNPYGRSPLSGAQIGRLNQLAAGNPTNRIAQRNAMTLFDFTRPELSGILENFDDKNSAQYKEALAIIQAGKAQLAKQPREDMLGPRVKPVYDQDVARFKFNAVQAQCEAQARDALLTKKLFYPYKPQNGTPNLNVVK